MKSPTIVLMSMLVTLLASACGSAQPITEPVAVIEAFYEALNDGDLDAAMSFVADDAEFELFPQTFSGKAQIRALYMGPLKQGLQTEIVEIQANGNKVSWTLRLIYGSQSLEEPYEAVVGEGMIVSHTVTSQ